MRLGIRARLGIASVALVALSVVAADLYLTATLEDELIQRIREDLVTRARLIAAELGAAVTRADPRECDALAGAYGRRARARVTLLRRDGAVLGDSGVALSQLGGLENHARRPEVRAAFRDGRGVMIRASATLGRRMVYAAVPVPGARGAVGAVRLAVPLAEVERAVAELHRAVAIAGLLALAVAVLISGIAAQLVSRGVRRLTDVARSMAAGELSARAGSRGTDEIALLGQTLDRLAESLSSSLSSLRAERDLLNRILLGMQEGVLVLGADGRIVMVNGALREMLLLPNDVAGRPLLEVVRDAELKELLGRACDPGAATPPMEIELGGLRPRQVLVHAAPLPDEAGGALAVFVDVTELRRLESLRRDFVANVSHEFRTPIAAACSAAETLRAAQDNPEASRRFVEMISRNLARLQRLVEDLLDLSRFESRQFRFAEEPVELDELAEHVLALHAQAAESKHVALASDVPRGLVARADRSALEQVLGNLVDNALKYCPENAHVRLEASAEEGQVRISVADDGPGIAAEHLSRIFERFYRVDPGRSRALGGTGLGLAIVKHLVEGMGGRVAVQSQPQQGTRFSFTLPREGSQRIALQDVRLARLGEPTELAAVGEEREESCDEALRALREQFLLMGAKVEKMIAGSVRALLERDRALAHGMIAFDHEIDRLELEIDRRCRRLLTRWRPPDEDVRFVTTVLKLVTDLERIGDLGESICERVIDLDAAPSLDAFHELPLMAETVERMFHEALDALVKQDTARARQVIEQDKAVDAYYARMFGELLSYMTQNPDNVALALRVQAIGKHLERIGDHTTNIAEMAIFMIQGRDVRHLAGAAAAQRAQIPHGVLFLCAHNAARSQMAEGLARKLSGIKVWSAGSHPAEEVHPLAVRVMRELGIDISRQRPKQVKDVPLGDIDTVVTLRTGEEFPAAPRAPQQLAWHFDDPAAVQGTEAQRLEAFRRVRDALRPRIVELLQPPR